MRPAGDDPKAAAVLGDAEPDALTCLDPPASHWERLRTSNVQERTGREIKRRPRVVQVFPSPESLECLAGVVLCDIDGDWSERRYFSEKRIAELYAGRREPEPPSPERLAGIQEIARRAIEASVGLADEMEAA